MVVLPIVLAFKLFQVDTYRHKLKERQWRKNLAKEFSILHNSTSVGFRTYYTAKKKQSREDRSVFFAVACSSFSTYKTYLVKSSSLLY